MDMVGVVKGWVDVDEEYIAFEDGVRREGRWGRGGRRTDGLDGGARGEGGMGGATLPLLLL